MTKQLLTAGAWLPLINKEIKGDSNTQRDRERQERGEEDRRGGKGRGIFVSLCPIAYEKKSRTFKSRLSMKKANFQNCLLYSVRNILTSKLNKGKRKQWQLL